jgi:hypothetical protein
MELHVLHYIFRNPFLDLFSVRVIGFIHNQHSIFLQFLNMRNCRVNGQKVYFEYFEVYILLFYGLILVMDFVQVWRRQECAFML